MKHFTRISAILMVLFLVFAGTASAQQYYRPWVKTVELTVQNPPVFESGLGLADSGDEWFVNSNASGTAAGTSWTNACLTIDACINLATASNGDIIHISSTHAESFTAADGFDVDKAGLTLIFHGEGQNQATLTFADTDATVACGAANVTIFGGRYLAGISAVVLGIAVEATCDNFTLINPVFPEPATSSYEFLDAIDLAAGADNVKIINAWARSADATGAAHFIEAGNGVNNGLEIINPDIEGEYSVAAIWSDTADLETRIAGGVITNMTNGQHAVEFTAAATGVIQDILLRTDAQGTALDPGSLGMSNVLWDDDAVADATAGPVVLGALGPATIGPINSTTTDSVNGKIGTDTEMADSSLYDLLGAGAKTLAISASVGADVDGATTDTLQGKIGTDTEMADNSLYDLLGAGAKTLAISTSVGSDVDSATTDNLQGKIGTDTELADNSLYDLLGAGSKTLDLSAAIGSSVDGTTTDTLHGKIGTDTEMADSSLYDMLGANNATTTDSLNGKIGTDTEMADSSLYDILLQMERTATGSTAVMANGDTIFTIAGGPIKIVELVSVCITLNDATASTLQYSADPTVGAATTISGASASLANAAAGSGVVLNMTALATAPDVVDPLVDLGGVDTRGIIVNEGIITIVVGVGTTTGTWKHYIRYQPLAPGVTVTGT